MKKIILLIVAILNLAQVAYCQEYMKVEKNNGTIVKFDINDVMRVFFDEEEESTEMEFVDLGLSVKWAKWNLGANSISEEGELYAWGELETKSKYISANYQTKNYLIDYKKGNSGTQWDVVSKKMGHGCRIPTDEEFRELVGYCDIEKVYIDNQLYYKFTGKTGNSIYFKYEFDEMWLSGISSSRGQGCYTYLSASDYNNWEALVFLEDFWKGHPIRPVCQVQTEQVPTVTLTYSYNENTKKHEFFINVDEETMSKYPPKGIEAVGYNNEKAEVGILWSAYPDILSSQNPFSKIAFRFLSDNTYQSYNTYNFTDGKIYNAIAYVIIGGVYYWGEELQFTAGSNLPKYNVGDYYPNAQNPEGIVCYTNDSKQHGKIISFEETKAQWDISDFSSATGALSGESGAINDKKITDNGHPAAKWCRSLGTGWFLPARYELTKASHNVSAINKALKEMGHSKIEGFYWSSTEHETYGSTLAYIVCMAESNYSGYNSGWSSYNTKTVNRSVRAMKVF